MVNVYIQAVFILGSGNRGDLSIMRDVATCNCDYFFRYSLMIDCWRGNAELRPSFAEIVVLLSDQLAVVAEYTDLSSPPDVVNVQVEDRV